MAFIRLRNLSVEFPIYQGSHRSLKKLMLPASLQGNLARDRIPHLFCNVSNEADGTRNDCNAATKLPRNLGNREAVLCAFWAGCLGT